MPASLPPELVDVIAEFACGLMALGTVRPRRALAHPVPPASDPLDEPTEPLEPLDWMESRYPYAGRPRYDPADPSLWDSIDPLEAGPRGGVVVVRGEGRQ